MDISPPFLFFENEPGRHKVQGHIFFSALFCPHTCILTNNPAMTWVSVQSPALKGKLLLMHIVVTLCSPLETQRWQRCQVLGESRAHFTRSLVCSLQLLWEAEGGVAEGATRARHPRIPSGCRRRSTAAASVQEAGRPTDSHLQTAASSYEGNSPSGWK